MSNSDELREINEKLDKIIAFIYYIKGHELPDVIIKEYKLIEKYDKLCQDLYDKHNKTKQEC